MNRVPIRISRIAPLAALLMGLLLSGRANAAFTITLSQSGNDVIATGTGSLNLTGLADLGLSSIYGSSIRPSVGSITIGAVDFEVRYRAYFSTVAGFGADVYRETTFGTGYHVGMLATASVLYLSASYVSGTQFTSTTTFSNISIAGLGLTNEPFVYNYSATQGGSIVDTITIRNGNGAVPEPASGLMCGIAGLIGLGFRSVRRHRTR